MTRFFCLIWNTEAVIIVLSNGWYFTPTSYCSPSVGLKALPLASVPVVGRKDSE
ncbi:hypothetical protein D3C80_2233850 [compost metagenome]